MKRFLALVLPFVAVYSYGAKYPPVPEKAQTPYYRWSLPQNDKWSLLQSNEQQTTIAKSGEDKYETFIMDVVVYQLPEIKTEGEFLEFVKKGRLRDDDPSRFKNLVEDVIPYKGRKDLCVSFHHVSEDHKAVRKKVLILEDYGYSCRLPQNKTIGINFAYSHRYLSDKKESDAPSRAEALFSQLEY